MICIAENNSEGGVNGGAGSEGQASQNATGAAAHGYGYPILECTTGTPCEFIIQFTKDYDGNVQSDLSGIVSVTFCARPSMDSDIGEISVACTFSSDGLVTLSLGEDQLNYNNGVWFAEFRCTDSSGKDRQNYRAFLVIRKGTKGSRPDTPRTITVLDVRLAIMDMSPSANKLLEDLEFSDVQILHAVERCIDEFNEIPPTISKRFDGISFPWVEHLIKGAVGYLMQEKAYQYLRNKMNYSAAGFSEDQSDKGNTYVQLGTAARAEWKQFMSAKKTELNMADCFGTVDIPYFDGSSDW